jgi:ABC-2 type transport system permease protein
MRNLCLLTAFGIKSYLRSKITLIIAWTIILMVVIALAVALSLFMIAPELKSDAPDRSRLELSLGLIMYSSCVIGVGVNLSSYAFQSLVREKSRGVINSLLATPLKASDIWAAKSLAVFLPGLVIGEFLALIVMLAVNFYYFVPEPGFIMTPWIAMSTFLCAPLVYLSLSFLVHNVGLTGKPATANVILQVFLPLFVTLMINLIVRNILDVTSWTFMALNLGIAAALGVAALCLKPRLKNETIVLSG